MCRLFPYTPEFGYSDIDLCDTSVIASYTQWYQLTVHKTRAFLPTLVRHTQDNLPRM